MDADLLSVAYRPVHNRDGDIIDVHRRREYAGGAFKFDTIAPARYRDLVAADAGDNPDPFATAFASIARADGDADRGAAGDGPSAPVASACDHEWVEVEAYPHAGEFVCAKCGAGLSADLTARR